MILNKFKRVLEFRAVANGLKEMEEQRAAMEEEMSQLVNKVEEEKRAFTEEESTRFDDLEKEKIRLDKTLKVIEAKRAAENREVVETVKKEDSDTKLEERAFANYIRGVVEQRADVNLTVGDSGAVIPSTIANKIIKKVYDICPIYQLATRYNIGGTLNIPYYDESEGTITMAYASEFTELESSNGKFKSIELKGFLAGTLSKISKSLVNNSQFDIVSFTINAMAESISKWIEKELLNGTTDKIEGLSKVSAAQTITTASAVAIVADELIDVQEAIPDLYQASAIWIMNKKIRNSIRKLKNSDGDYILNKDMNAKWGYTLLGKEVYTTDNMKGIEAGATTIFYGDMSGLAVKLSEDVSIEVLREKFATQHALGIVGWIEIDSKIENAQKISQLKMKAV